MVNVNVVRGLMVFGFSFLFLKLVSGVMINEVMYNPSESEYYNEWVELYNNESYDVNLSGYKLCGDFLLSGYVNRSGDLNLDSGMVIKAGEYVVITDGGSGTEVYDNFNVSGIAMHVNKSSICGGLSNSKNEEIILSYGNNSVDVLNYDPSWALEGYSIEFDKKVWKQSLVKGGSAGRENSVVGLCDFGIKVLVDSLIFNGSVRWRFRVFKEDGYDKVNLSVKRVIRNSNMDVVKEYRLLNVSNVLNYRTSSLYKPNLAFNDAYFIEVGVVNISCKDLNEDNDFDSVLVYLKKDEEVNISGVDTSPYLEIVKYDKEVKFGDVVFVKVRLYKGDSGKNVVKVFVEDVSEKSKVYVYGKYLNYSFVVPVQIKLNCDNQFKDGKYRLVVEGLGEKEYGEVVVRGNSSLCGDVGGVLSNPVVEEVKKGLREFNGSGLVCDVFYEKEEGKNFAIWFFSSVLVLVLIYLILKW